MSDFEALSRAYDLPARVSSPLKQILQILRHEPLPVREQSLTLLRRVLNSLPDIEGLFCIPDDIATCPTPASIPESSIRLPPIRDMLLYRQDDLPLPHDSPQSGSQTPTSTTADTLDPTAHKRKRSRVESSASSSDEHECQSLVLAKPSSLSWTWQASVALAPDYGCQAVTQAAARFHKELRRLQISEKKNNVRITTQINPVDVATMTKFFFTDVFGEGCQKRMFSLLDALVTQGDTSTAAIAAERATDTTLPPEVQVFFADYSRWHTEEVKHTGVKPIVANTLRSYELYNSFFQLREKAMGPSGEELQAFLRARGFLTTVGVDIRSCISKYLAKELGLTTLQLNNALQAQQGIFQLAQKFGRGILVLLPKVASHRITRIGTQKMLYIIRVLFNVLPEARDICSAAEHLIPYVQDDSPLPTPLFLGQQASLRPRLSLLETFTLIRSAEAPVLPLQSATPSNDDDETAIQERQ